MGRFDALLHTVDHSWVLENISTAVVHFMFISCVVTCTGLYFHSDANWVAFTLALTNHCLLLGVFYRSFALVWLGTGLILLSHGQFDFLLFALCIIETLRYMIAPLIASELNELHSCSLVSEVLPHLFLIRHCNFIKNNYLNILCSIFKKQKWPPEGNVFFLWAFHSFILVLQQNVCTTKRKIHKNNHFFQWQVLFSSPWCRKFIFSLGSSLTNPQDDITPCTRTDQTAARENDHRSVGTLGPRSNFLWLHSSQFYRNE